MKAIVRIINPIVTQLSPGMAVLAKKTEKHRSCAVIERIEGEKIFCRGFIGQFAEGTFEYRAEEFEEAALLMNEEGDPATVEEAIEDARQWLRDIIFRKN